jgi:hypothetical protein
MDKTPQQVFDETYISASEICRTLDVTRGAVTNAQKRGLLPEPIKLEQGGGYLCLWVRQQVQPALNAWALMLTTRKRTSTVTEAHA